MATETTDPSPLPSIGTLVEEALRDFRDEPGGWLLAGLALMIVTYLVPILALVIGTLLLAIGMAVTGEGSGWPFFVLLLVVALGAAAIGPFLASVYRAARERLDRGGGIGFTSPFDRTGEDLGATILVTLAVGLVVGIASMLFVLPGVIAAWLLVWTLPAVYLHRRSVGEAFRLSFAHVRDEPAWTLGVALIGVVIAFVAGAIPILGPLLGLPLWIAFHTRAFRAAFGVERPERLETLDETEPATPERERWPAGPPVETH